MNVNANDNKWGNGSGLEVPRSQQSYRYVAKTSFWC